MFMVNAVFNKEHLKNIISDLVEKDIPGITILPALSKGQIGVSEKELELDFNEKVKIEVVVSDEDWKNIVMEIIRIECMDLGYGAGKIWITPVLEVERIRTLEKDKDALKINKKRKLRSNDGGFESIDTPNT